MASIFQDSEPYIASASCRELHTINRRKNWCEFVDKQEQKIKDKVRAKLNIGTHTVIVKVLYTCNNSNKM